MAKHKLPNYGKGEKEGIHEDFKGFHARHGTKGPSFVNKPAKADALKKRVQGIESKGGINEHGDYCRHCMSPQHKTPDHKGLVKAGKITR